MLDILLVNTGARNSLRYTRGKGEFNDLRWPAQCRPGKSKATELAL